MLSFRLARAFGEGQLVVKATDGREEFLVRMEPRRSLYEVHRNGQPVGPGGRRRMPAWTGDLQVEVSLFDRQFVLAFDGHSAVVHPYEATEPVGKPTPRPLAIGSQGLGVELRDLRVYRDVYYTHPVGVKGRWGLDEPFHLGPDEYFVLGDNSPVSEDSRTWPHGPAVPAQALVGRPLLVHFPAEHLDLGLWDIQVPDPGRIRYIR
jgi:signal peptidase I